MKFRLLLFLCIILSSKVRAQKDILPIYKHTISYSDHKIMFQLQEPDEKVKFTDPSKKYYWYSANQLKVTQGGFGGKLLNGTYFDFYLNSNLKEKGTFNMGLKNGEWNSWRENGTLMSKMNYRGGELDGSFFTYDTAGHIVEQGTYKKGLLNGKFTKTAGKDSVQVLTYSNGVVKPEKTGSFWSHIPLIRRKKTN